MPSIYRSEQGRDRIRAWCREQLDGWDVPHELREVTANGMLTHAVEAGPEDGATVVFVPGTNLNAATSLPLLTALVGRGLRVVALDVPGQPGLSLDDRSAQGREWYGAWLADAVVRLDLGAAVLAGHSLGGAIVLAADVPTATRRVVLSSAGLCALRITPGVLLDSMAWLLGKRRWGTARLLRRMHGPGARPTDHEVTWMTLVARHADSSGAPWVAAPAVALPTVAAAGEHDVFLPPERLGPAVRERLGVDLVVVPGAGHLLPDEQPDLVAELIAAPS